MLKTVAEFSINYNQFLDPNGKTTQELPSFAKDNNLLISLYKKMQLLRSLDAKAIALQRTGKMGTYPACLGQEAVAVAIGDCMDENDVLCPSYREQGIQMQRGLSLSQILSFWGGYESGSITDEKYNQDFPNCIPIGTQCLHAAGVAKAIKIKNQTNRAVVTVIGDGGSSQGDFYEAMNVAGAWQLPLLFIINNNQWAISVPREIQSHAETLAQKAIAAGIPGIQVDGCDVVAVKDAVSTALENIKNNQGPQLIETISYRICDHTTADDASRYRDKKEVELAKQHEPMKRLKQYLMSQKAWDEAQEKSMLEDCKAEIEQAVKTYENQSKPKPTDIFNFMYENLPESYYEQYSELDALGENS